MDITEQIRNLKFNVLQMSFSFLFNKFQHKFKALQKIINFCIKFTIFICKTFRRVPTFGVSHTTYICQVKSSICNDNPLAEVSSREEKKKQAEKCKYVQQYSKMQLFYLNVVPNIFDRKFVRGRSNYFSVSDFRNAASTVNLPIFFLFSFSFMLSKFKCAL